LAEAPRSILTTRRHVDHNPGSQGAGSVIGTSTSLLGVLPG